jgi:1-acyl-sn-glycerol-3-phosphate acyltransferase
LNRSNALTSISVIKKLLVFAVISIYVVSTMLISIGPGGTLRASRNAHRLARWLMRILKVNVSVRGKIQAHGMIVSNHLSYIDIFSVLSVRPVRFITFTELGQAPGIGLLATLGQTLYVNRSKPSLVKRDIAHFESELANGMPIVLFPEGSSFDGSKLMPFKSSLFESAIRTGAMIQPICIRYTELEGGPVTFKNRDRVFYYGDMELMPQLLRIFGLKSLSVEIVACEPFSPVGKTRKELAELAYNVISQHFLCVKD